VSEEYLFRVKNHHSESCGTPPQIDNPKQYVSYFENVYGEQAIFLYDHETQEATLYMGEANWEIPYKVVAGRVRELTLNRPEQLWLLACWEAATRERIETLI
jgi:hypothetical protein